MANVIMNQIIIFGGEGTGMMAAAALESQGKEVLGFLNDVVPKGGTIGKFKKFPVLGKMDEFNQWLGDPDVGFHVSIVGYMQKKQTFEKLKFLRLPEDRLVSVIAPSAIVQKDYCRLGNGVQFGNFAYLSVDTEVGDYSVLFSGAYVLHDTVLERFVHIGSNATVGANVLIKEAAFIGSNATVKEKVTIGRYSIVGAGTVVIRDVPDYSVVAGNPAKVIRRLDV